MNWNCCSRASRRSTSSTGNAIRSTSTTPTQPNRSDGSGNSCKKSPMNNARVSSSSSPAPVACQSVVSANCSVRPSSPFRQTILDVTSSRIQRAAEVLHRKIRQGEHPATIAHVLQSPGSAAVQKIRNPQRKAPVCHRRVRRLRSRMMARRCSPARFFSTLNVNELRLSACLSREVSIRCA